MKAGVKRGVAAPSVDPERNAFADGASSSTRARDRAPYGTGVVVVARPLRVLAVRTSPYHTRQHHGGRVRLQRRMHEVR